MLVTIMIFVILIFLVTLGTWGVMNDIRQLLVTLNQAKVAELKVFGATDQDPRKTR